VQQSITMASEFGRDFVQLFRSHFLALVQAMKPANEQGNGDYTSCGREHKRHGMYAGAGAACAVGLGFQKG